MSIITVAEDWLRLLLDAWQVTSVFKSERPNLPNDSCRLGVSAIDVNVLLTTVTLFFIHITLGAGLAAEKKNLISQMNQSYSLQIIKYTAVKNTSLRRKNYLNIPTCLSTSP